MADQDKKLEKKLLKQQKKDQKLAKFQNKPKFNTPPTKQTTNLNTNVTTKSAFFTDYNNKNMDKPIPSSYDPIFVESFWQTWWERAKLFSVSDEAIDKVNNKKEPFVVLMPPPNVTGTLHLGHALTCAFEDSLCRYNRMLGRPVVYVPGCDHAGIATQVVVERQLYKTAKLTRFDLGREKFLEKVYEWKKEKGQTIFNQIRRLGVSCDWDREFFTMSKSLSDAVLAAFVRLYDDGMIYRANRLVNWSCTLNSVISDVEVDKKEIVGENLLNIPGYVDKVKFGYMSYFFYLVVDEPFDVEKFDFEKDLVSLVEKQKGNNCLVKIATTRLETMLADVAVVVNPNDPRYKHFFEDGKQKYVLHPFCRRLLPLLSDTSIDIELGTGAMKLTPAHDFDDYELGKKLNLPCDLTFLDDTGCVTKNVDEVKKLHFLEENNSDLLGLPRFAAREAIKEKLKKLNLFASDEPHNLVLPVCSRTGDVIEPMLKPQWYLKCEYIEDNEKSPSFDALNLVNSGQIKIYPQNTYEKTFNSWMTNCRDWCVSRQLWWGHRIPAYCADLSSNGKQIWIVAETEEKAREKLSQQLIQQGETTYKIDEIELKQDEDVLDTWFSSALLPFSVFGWPDENKFNQAINNKFFPTTLLETGHDILFFWVARMIFMTRLLTKNVPFTNILLHQLIRDAHGRKMSKSLGNIVDPLDVINGINLEQLQQKLKLYNLEEREMQKAMDGQAKDYPQGIPQCGADALRFYLCHSREVNIDVRKIQSVRFFCNKVWNLTKFVLSMPNYKTNMKNICATGGLKNLSEMENFLLQSCYKESMSLIDRYLIDSLKKSSRQYHISMGELNLAGGAAAVYDYLLYVMCDVYVEAVKPNKSDAYAQLTSTVCLMRALQMLSPFMPYLCEELYQRISHVIFDGYTEQTMSSIGVASFGQYFCEGATTMFEGDLNKHYERDCDFVQNTVIEQVVRNLRAMRDTYTNNTQKSNEKNDLFMSVVVADEELFEGLKKYEKIISTLVVRSGEVVIEKNFYIEDSQQIHVESVLDSKITIRMRLDNIDKESELTKQRANYDKVNVNIEDLKKSMSLMDLNTTPKVVLEDYKSRLDKLQLQERTLKNLIENLDKMA